MTTNVFNAKIGEFENEVSNHFRHITTPESNRFGSTILNTKSKQTNIAANSDLNPVSQSANKTKEKQKNCKRLI